MAALTCDICGGSLSMDSSGEFAVCDSCGTKHTKERMQTKAQEITGTVKVSNQAGIESLMKRGHLAQEDGKWSEANKYFDQVLDIDPEYAPAYVGKLGDISYRNELRLNNMSINYVKTYSSLEAYYQLRCDNPDYRWVTTYRFETGATFVGYYKSMLDDDLNYKKAIRFADETLRAQLEGYNNELNKRIEGYNNEIKKRFEELKNKYTFFMIIREPKYLPRESWWKTELQSVYSLSEHSSYRTPFRGNLRDGLVFVNLRTDKQYMFSSRLQDGSIGSTVSTIRQTDNPSCYGYGSLDKESIIDGDIAAISIEEEQRRESYEREHQAWMLYLKGKSAYEEGKKSLFFRKKKYQEAADFFRQAAEQGHAEAREYLDRLKTEGKAV